MKVSVTMPATPKGAKKPQDHNPAKAEARGEKIAVEHDGATYVIDREAADDVELFEHLEQNHIMTALKGFLGERQWDAWKNAHRGPNGKVSLAAVEPLLDSILEAVGGAGNS